MENLITGRLFFNMQRRGSLHKAVKACIVMLLLISLLFLTGCPALSDWGYSLPNGYGIVRISSRQVALVSDFEKPTTPFVIRNYITAFCFNERYVCVRRIEVDYQDATKEDIEKTADEEYYILDTQEEELYGPFSTEEEYLEQLHQCNIDGLCDWIKTDSKPEDAK